MDDEKNWFQKFSTFMDQNIRGVQYGIYSVAGLGLILALRSVRPFAKFYFPSDIPSHFIEKKMPFVATVKMIQPSLSMGENPLLIVDHHPLIPLPKTPKSEGLPLNISSVNITSNGFVWMQSLLTEQRITFVPLRISKDKVHSVVFNQKQNIGQQLVNIGFATVSPMDMSLENDTYYLKYYKQLLSAERKAESKGLGVWAGHKVPFSKLMLNKLRNVLPYSF